MWESKITIMKELEVDSSWYTFWTTLAIARDARDCTLFVVMGHDTGSGVILYTWVRESNINTLFLPGHAIVDGKLISKPMLEPSDISGVTMGERVAELEKRLKDQQDTAEQRLNTERLVSHKQRESYDKRINELSTLFQGEHEELVQLRAEMAKGGLSSEEESSKGFLSLMKWK